MKQALGLGILALALISAGCRPDATVAPTADSSTSLSKAGGNSSPEASKPQYENAYYNDTEVLINAIELSQHAPEQAQADLYEVVYPIGWESMNVGNPQCNPCDHEGNGIDFTDYHDHVIDSVPSSPGHGEYRALWHVYVVLPAYNHDSAHDSAVNAAYAAHLPIRSEQEVDAVLGETLQDGSPVATEVDANLYFLCAVVDPHAGG
jgi:hypothetical protein